MRYRHRFNLPSRAIIPEIQAKELLKPYFDRLFLCVKDAWEAWEKLGRVAPELKKPLDSTARANYLWNHIKSNVRRRFKDVRGVTIIEKGRTFVLSIDGVALLRFKKVDGQFRTRNVPTVRQLELQMQLKSQMVELPGLPPEATWLTCGYLLDPFETTIETYVITCFVGSDRKYVIPFGGGEASIEKMQPAPSPVPLVPGKAKVFPISVPQETKKGKPKKS
jgi:hypothetical protein